MRKDSNDFWTCHPRGTELEKLWKAHLTSEDGFFPELSCGDKYGHALAPYQEKPLLMWGRPPPSPTLQLITLLRLPLQRDQSGFTLTTLPVMGENQKNSLTGAWEPSTTM